MHVSHDMRYSRNTRACQPRPGVSSCMVQWLAVNDPAWFNAWRQQHNNINERENNDDMVIIYWPSLGGNQHLAVL